MQRRPGTNIGPDPQHWPAGHNSCWIFSQNTLHTYIIPTIHNSYDVKRDSWPHYTHRAWLEIGFHNKALANKNIITELSTGGVVSRRGYCQQYRYRWLGTVLCKQPPTDIKMRAQRPVGRLNRGWGHHPRGQSIRSGGPGCVWRVLSAMQPRSGGAANATRAGMTAQHSF